MTAEPGLGNAGAIVYIDHSDIREGRLEDLRTAIGRIVDFIEEREPRLVVYGFHLDEEARRMTVVAVHPDTESLELHMEVGREEFRKLGEMITLRSIEVYGSISDSASRLLDQKLRMLGEGGVVVTERFAGFTRLSPSNRPPHA